MTVAQGLGERANALNFVRLVLAASVVVGHCYLLTATVPPTPWLHPRLAEWAVNGFFAISGYLIAGSRMRLPLLRFLERRARRLLPGYWTVLLVVAFGIAPLAALLAHEHWSLQSACTYVVRNLGIWVAQPGIDTTLLGTPSGIDEWNGPLWTLAYEAACYVAFGLVLGLGFVRRHGVIVFALVVIALMALHPVVMTENANGVLRDSVRLSSYFAAGVLCWFLGDRIPLRWWVPVGAASCVAVLSVAWDGQWYGQVPAAVALLSIGAMLPVRIGAVNDISYGVYIYGWPVQQLLVSLGFAGYGVMVFQGLSIGLVAPLAWVSWVAVERRWLPQRVREAKRDVVHV